jgi:hypothetical protein
MSDFQEYITSLDLMDKVVIAEDVHAAWDELYTFIYANFPKPETSSDTWHVSCPSGYQDKHTSRKDPIDHVEGQDMVLMFKQDREQIIERLRSIPPVILAATFPVWVARYLLRFAKVPVDAARITTFNEFYRRYGNMILSHIYTPY